MGPVALFGLVYLSLVRPAKGLLIYINHDGPMQAGRIICAKLLNAVRLPGLHSIALGCDER